MCCGDYEIEESRNQEATIAVISQIVLIKAGFDVSLRWTILVKIHAKFVQEKVGQQAVRWTD